MFRYRGTGRRFLWGAPLLTLMFLCAFALRAHAAQDLIGYWNFDEASGTTSADSSGNGNNGSFVGGGVTHSTDLPPTSCFVNTHSLSFNGTGAYVSIPDNATMDPANAISISFWMNANTVSNGYQHIVFKQGPSVTSYGVWLNGNHIYMEDNDNSVRSLTSNATVTAGTWHYITVTYDGTTQALYIDGALDNSQPLANITLEYENSPVKVGSGDYNNSFNGYVDDLRIYGRALTGAEVADLAGGGCGPGVGLDAESFSPADNATGVATNTNLSLTFGTTTVATSTGAIGLYKTSDDSLVESFTVNSPRLTRGTTVASTTFTIDPSALLSGSTGYYVWVASTTFEDGLGTFWGGTAASTTWNFTTAVDNTAPVISSVVASSIGNTSVTISWNTDEAASTRIAYSTDTSYGTYTSETDTSPRVTSHASALSGLSSCTTYNFKVVSADSALNYATSTASSFTTTGCAPRIVPSGGGALPWCSGPSAPGWNSSLPDGGCGAKSAVVAIPPASACPAYPFTRTLRFGMRGEDVRALQRLMNCLGFKLGDTGPGSPGKETDLFVERTYAAVIKFQEAYASEVLAPINATKGTGIFAEYSRAQIAKLTKN